MKTILLKKKDKGQAALQVLLSVVTMLFVIGLIVMIFSIMGAELVTHVRSDVTANATAVDAINTTYSEVAGVVDWFGIIIVITAMVVLIGLTAVIINSIRGTGILGMATRGGRSEVGTA